MKQVRTVSFFIIFCFASIAANGQVFTFECVGDYISGADCPECTGQTTARLFNGLAIKRSGAFFKNIDCPYIIRVQGSNLVITEIIPNPETVTINLLSSGFSTITGFRDSVACMCARQDSSWINGVDTTHFVNASNATSHTLSLTPSPSGGSIQLIEGANVTLTTGGTALDATVTIAATSGGGTDLTYTGASSPVTLNSSTGTDVTVTAGTGISLTATGTDLTINNTGDLSATNEAWTVDADDADTELITTQTVKFEGGGIIVTDYVPGTDVLTITGTEIDGSTTNEAWTIDGDAGATEVISNQTVLFNGAGINTTNYDAGTNTLTITGTEVDGSTTNELQTLNNTSNATSHTATLSNSGGSIQLIEGTNITLTTGGTALDGTVTIAATETDGSITNEGILGVASGGSNDALLTSNTSTANGVTIAGAGINTVSESTSANGGTITITGTEVDGSTTNEIETFVSSSDATSHTVTLAPGTTSVQLIEGSNVTLTTGGTAANATVTIASTASGGTNYQTLRDDGVDMTQRAAANFESTSDIAFTLVDDAGNNETEINADIPLGAVDLDEIQNISTSVVLGNSTISPGPPIELTPTGGIEISGTNLQVSTNGITDGLFRQSVGLSVVGRSANSTGNVADIVAASDGDVLRRSGTTLGFGDVDLTLGVTGTLPVGNGGTGATNLVNNRVLTGNGTSPIVDESNLTFDGSLLTVTGNQIVGITTPSATQHALRFSNSVVSATNNVTQYGGRSLINLTNNGTPTGNSLTHWYAESNTAAPTRLSTLSGFNCFLVNSSPDVTNAYGMYGRLDEGSATTVSNRYGLRFDLNRITNNTDTHTGIGIQTNIADNSTSGRWTSATGISSTVTNALTATGGAITVLNNRGTGNTQTGLTINNTTSGSGVTTTNAYGLQMILNETSSGAVTNYYSIFSNTGPVATNNWAIYYSASGWLAHINGSLGLGSGTTTPARTLHVAGEARITDLVTDTPTKIVGADADGDIDTVGIGAEAELHITAGTLGTNFHTTIAPATLTTTTNNWNPTGLSTAWIIELSGNGSFVMLTGITAPAFNKTLTIYNNGTNSVLLPKESTLSTSGNRFNFEIVLFPGKQVELRYSTSAARWTLKSKAGLYDDVQELYANHVFQCPVSMASGDYDFWDIGSEAAASVVAPTSGVMSGVSVNTGASASGNGYVTAKAAMFQTDNSSGTATYAYCKAVVRTPSSLSDGTNDYTLRIGFGDVGGGGATDGMYFDYNHSNVSGNWGCATTNGGSTERNNSGIAVTTSTLYVLEMMVRPGLLVEYFINGTRVATNSSFVSTADDVRPFAEIEKSIGTTQRDFQIFTLQASVSLVNQP